jgi:WD40 repeat protein
MRSATNDPLDSLPLTLAVWIDDLCLRFEAAWRAGPPPRLEDYLAAEEDPERSVLLGELLRVELDWRQQRGDPPGLKDYQEKYPEYPTLIRELFEGLPPAEAADKAPPRPPGYTIEGELGQGGMGVVYRARQVVLNRVVALKMILAGNHARPEERARFRAEAEAVARLQHPNVVQIYDIGEYQGLPYFSLEYCEGGNLAQRLRGEPQQPRDAAALVQTLARGVHAAHQCGVIHRDLKPANVLLTREGTPKITDFGLAKHVEGSEELTQSGQLMGTPSYMAPEQAACQRSAIGSATDVYALGAIFYEMLTGRPPFRAASMLETLEQVRSQEPVAPRQLNPGVPRDLETITLKCLHKEPGRRYTTAEALAEDLRRWQAGEPIGARPVGFRERLAKWMKRRPAVTALLAALLLVTPVGMGGILWQAIEKGRALDRTKLQVYLNQIQLAQVYLGARQLDRAEETLQLCSRELRGFEWHYLRRLCKLEPRVLKGRNGTILNAAYSPDGRLLATGSEDGTLCVWETDAGTELNRWPSGTRHLAGLCFSGDGRYLLSTSRNQGLKVWDARSGKQLHHDPDAGGGIACAGSVVAAIYDRKGTAEVWSLVADGNAVRLEWRYRISLAGWTPFAVALDRRGEHLAVGGLNSLLKVWNIKGQAPRLLPGFVHERRLLPHNVNALAFSADGSLLASGSPHTTIWEVATGREKRSFPGATDRSCSSISFSAEGSNRLAATFEQHLVRIWDTRTGRLLQPPRRQSRQVRAVLFSPVNEDLLAIVRENTVTILNVAPGITRPSLILKQPPGDRHFQALAFSDDGRWLAARARDLGADSKVDDVLRWHTDERIHETGIKLDVPGEGLRANLAFIPDSQTLVVGSSTRAPFTWEPSGEPRGRWRVPPDSGTARLVAVSKQNRMATCDSASTIDLWDLEQGAHVRTTRFAGEVFTLAFSPDGSRLAVGGTKVQMYECSTGRWLYTLKGVKDTTSCLAFGRDGKLLVTGSYDQTLRLWRFRTASHSPS